MKDENKNVLFSKVVIKDKSGKELECFVGPILLDDALKQSKLNPIQNASLVISCFY